MWSRKRYTFELLQLKIFVHLHILSICGTFMAGVAILARGLGHRVTGQDAGIYPPMSHQLAAAGIPVIEGYAPEHLRPAPDCVIVGNALSRGNRAVEYLLDHRIPFTSGPAWLAENVLRDRWVMAVAGTHGKTTTAALLAFILDTVDPGDNPPLSTKPGFLIGGIPQDFGVSARLGDGPFFVVEADEYDTAFFDKRSKFIHYRPRTLVLNNLEFDHGDIFPDLAAIQTQFHHLVRTIPGNGRILYPERDEALEQVLAMGCWTPVERLGFFSDSHQGIGPSATWQAKQDTTVDDGSAFSVRYQGIEAGLVEWGLIGRHNVENALAAIAAAHHAGVPAASACRALGQFRGVKRRLEQRGRIHDITVYDDFAHHPTAIATTLAGLRARVGRERIIAVLEPRSNTMRLGFHRNALAHALAGADLLWIYRPPNLGWDVDAMVQGFGIDGHLCNSIDAIVTDIAGIARAGDHVLIMSNGGFGGIHERLIAAIKSLKCDSSHLKLHTSKNYSPNAASWSA
uniref:UDP-N-acetylmuramate--L-alanyl-gamma-D-glutamyl-meso-2,6-diaminoheptandioate ligase n=1 Tax=Candidatus Kentrum eta TaxID=2126337 RepID=A0A450V2Z2_9GAMM|nr:MAG: UDP-N-acetylmuramate: L-alanyl-gamma-D-glutamyl-meso-diaminopimelate ligase [Candidatus Kentron sp. H]VFJ99192.1 MAG: UDP-N-acetylmuramate: L-alanyl-gamma-D-glutamyl-meso-diaminopimelate ligase [Candidatus Kentron sp. H]VFK03327.1 MAG: UDP-N-acetylmuramate: L-alanyl-gamma-D-glutamyl-meso-diaminopimelate ligase [Candidatus Kentron sp. H]